MTKAKYTINIKQKLGTFSKEAKNRLTENMYAKAGQKYLNNFKKEIAQVKVLGTKILFLDKIVHRV